jgi:hypothetical protein
MAPQFAAPRPWVKLDLSFLDQDRVRDLGRRFGAAGPLVLIAVIMSAKQSAMAGLPSERQGTVSLRYGALRERAFVDSEDQAREIVQRLADCGLLTITDDDNQRFTAHLARWDAWEPQAVNGAARQRKYREAKKAGLDPC